MSEFRYPRGTKGKPDTLTIFLRPGLPGGGAQPKTLRQILGQKDWVLRLTALGKLYTSPMAYLGIPSFLEELVERLDAHAGLADRTAEAAAARQELRAGCSPKAWALFLQLEEAVKQRERVLFDVTVEFFLLPDDWEGPSLE